MNNVNIPDEKWYPIESDGILYDNGFQVSDYGRIKSRYNRILKPRSLYPTSKSKIGTYNIVIGKKRVYYNVFELMCLNIPELYKEGHYLVDYEIEDDGTNLFKDKVHPRWSKASEDDKWDYLEDLDIYISEKFDILDPDKMRCIPIRKDDNGYCMFYCPVLRRAVYMSRLVYVYSVLGIKNNLREHLKEKIMIGYIDNNISNYNPSNLYIKGEEVAL